MVILLLAGGLRCGVAFHDRFTGTEVFKRMSVCDDANSCTLGLDHRFAAGSNLRIGLDVAQDYPVPLEVACYYDEESNLTDDEKKVVFQESPLPKSGPGKILKTELRKPYWEGKTRQVN